MIGRLTVPTTEEKQVVDITERVQSEVAGVAEGLCLLSVGHTTVALATANMEPGTDLDMLDAFEAMMPRLQYRHPRNPERVTDHILSTAIGTSLPLSIEDGQLVIGRFQRVVLFEFDGPRERTVVVHIR